MLLENSQNSAERRKSEPKIKGKRRKNLVEIESLIRKIDLKRKSLRIKKVETTLKGIKKIKAKHEFGIKGRRLRVWIVVGSASFL